jgi:hypothetical protein
MGLPRCGLGYVDDNVELCSSSGDPIGRFACEFVSTREISPALIREPVFLGAGPTTAILIRARSVVQVHPGRSSVGYRMLHQNPQRKIQPTLICVHRASGRAEDWRRLANFPCPVGTHHASFGAHPRLLPYSRPCARNQGEPTGRTQTIHWKWKLIGSPLR